jgi:two-component sensor histidine kinase
VVAGNGIGISKRRDLKDADSVVLPLVIGLVQNQLDGKIEFINKAGTEVRVTFKEESPLPGEA